jgi:hypothetical protein
VLQANADGIFFEWRAPEFSLRHVVGDDGQIYSTLKTSEWAWTEDPGKPQLPVATVLAVVPPSGEVTLEVQDVERSQRSLDHPILPASAPEPVGEATTHLGWTWARDEQAYTGTASWPADVVTLEAAGWMRGHRLMRVTFYPVRFDPQAQKLEVTERVRVRLRFPDPAIESVQTEMPSESTWDADAPFVALLQSRVINPEQVNRLGTREPPASAQAEALSPDTETARALVAPPHGTEYLIITHSAFVQAVTPLAEHRATQDGLSVHTTTVENVYTAYSGGAVSYQAIKSYIADAYHGDLSSSLTYVLLVGDGVLGTASASSSPRSGQNFIPPYPQVIDPPWYQPEEAASDNRFATMDGSSDQIADVLLGRLPVNSVAEATAIVQKILAYETKPPRWPWTQRVLFFAGDELDAPYHDYSDEVYDNHLPSDYVGTRVYFCTSDCNEPHEFRDIYAAQAATKRELNTGGFLASYVGHSSWYQWAVDPKTGAPLFHVDDVSGLGNGEALPVVLEMTCYTSDFSDASSDTLDESLVRQAGGGAVATWGSTWLGLSLGHNVLHERFVNAAFQENTTIGEAAQAAKLDLVALGNPYYMDLLDTFVLFGDPAMTFNKTIVPWAAQVFLPAAPRGN